LQLPDVLSVLLQHQTLPPITHPERQLTIANSNNAYEVSRGHSSSVNLDGAKFWITGGLGADFSQGKMDWAVVTFDQATTTTKDQQDALGAIVPHFFPVKWNSNNNSGTFAGAGPENRDSSPLSISRQLLGCCRPPACFIR
jgi:hypothetical protein